MRLNSYDGGDGDDDNDCVGVDVDDDISDGDDDASCATLALRSCIITAGRRPTHAISIFFTIIIVTIGSILIMLI